MKFNTELPEMIIQITSATTGTLYSGSSSKLVTEVYGLSNFGRLFKLTDSGWQLKVSEI